MSTANIPKDWMEGASLSVVVLGASGDVTKRKAIPAIFNLWKDGLVPKEVMVYGFGRTPMEDIHLRQRVKPFLEQTCHNKSTIEAFLERCVYRSGKDYGDVEACQKISEEMKAHETELGESFTKHHRILYLALPPTIYVQASETLHKTCMQDKEKGFTRIIVEKPFGRDLESFEALHATLSKYFSEDQIYRIDHFLGNGMVQNVSTLRFSNRWVEKVWDRRHVQCVVLTFKDREGTELRGGYFDKYGIIRDVIQSHSMQVLSLLAMETPSTLNGPAAVKAIRDAKVAVLNTVLPPTVDDVVLGQYDGYTFDPTIEDPDSVTPTYAALKLMINTPRWSGVPFILKAGKSMNEDKTEIRIQFKDSPGAATMFGEETKAVPRNEFVMTMHPKEAIYFKTNVKKPGFATVPVQSELEVNYENSFHLVDHSSTSDSYTRLVLDVCLGKQAAFVRDDELRRSWEILTPLLQKLEADKVKPIIYKTNTRGPKEADAFVAEQSGYVRNTDYKYYKNEVPKVQGTCDVGLWGLAVMGQNFALNMASHGFSVCVGNRSPQKVGNTVERAQKEGNLPITGSKDAKDFVAHIKKPRKVIILVQAGKPVDETIANLAQHMEPGDVIIDGGNEWYPNSVRRAQGLEPRGVHFIGMGISGGEEGARNGPSLMPGGPKEAYDLIEPILTKCAAQTATGPCAGYLGPIGAGNYVKMVHNGIEYGDMQLIAEVYDILHNIGGLSNKEMAELFEKWNRTELESYLIEITAKVLIKDDEVTGKGQVVDYILDKTGMKGTGRWTIQEAAEKSVAAPTMAAALETRFLSGRKDERESASKVLASPFIDHDVNKDELIKDLRMALYASKVCSYAQGLSLIKAASDHHNWGIDLSECARLWTGGCIIRAKLLDKIQESFSSNPDLDNLLLDQSVAADMNMRQRSWRRVVAQALTSGIACPSLCSSLTYFDSYRRARLPANLTQAQRDFFGGHTYERTDMPGRFHTAWTDAHKDIGDANQRVEGEKLQT